MPTITSGGQHVTRARLVRVLDGLPVHPAHTARDAPFAWRLEHELDRRRQFHPWNRWTDAEFAAARDPDMEQAAQRLADVGYHVIVRPHPDPVELAALPEHLRDQFDAAIPMTQPLIVPD